METYNKSDELTHHGVKGQKWGVRRTEAQLARARGKVEKLESKLKARGGSEKSSGDSEKPSLSKVKLKPKDMTDEELQARIDRLKLEQNYAEAVKDSKTITRGHRFIEKYLDATVEKLSDNVAADLTSQLAKALGAMAINSVAKKVSKGSISDDMVFSNNKKKG